MLAFLLEVIKAAMVNQVGPECGFLASLGDVLRVGLLIDLAPSLCTHSIALDTQLIH